MRFIDPIHQHRDALEAQGPQHSAQLVDQFVAIIAAVSIGQRLVGEW